MRNLVLQCLQSCRPKSDSWRNAGHVIAGLIHAALRILAAIILLQVSLAHADEDFLEPDLAFKFSAKLADAKTVEIAYEIADGYYMYRERFQFKASGAQLGTPILPAGKVKYDETFQKDVETYRKRITIHIPVDAAGPFTLAATSQGCADKGLCYAPQESQVTLSNASSLLDAVANARDPDNVSAAQIAPVTRGTADGQRQSVTAQAPAESEQGRIDAALSSGKLFAIIPLFLLLGIGLSFTPCVLPMVPILASIIVGEGAQVPRRRGFVLAATYSLGMVLVYTALGIAAGLIGEGLSATLQNPWVLGGFAVMMFGQSLSMFGV